MLLQRTTQTGQPLMCSYLISMRLGHLYVLARELLYELTEPHGALSLLIICKCWNRDHCIAPSLLCCFAHKCSRCFGPHHVGACPVEPLSQSCPSCKRPVDAFPPRSSGSCGSTPNSHRLNLCWMTFVMGLNWVLVLLKMQKCTLSFEKRKFSRIWLRLST